MKLGSIILYKNTKGFLSWLQRWVVGMPFSHTSIHKGNDELGREIEFEANLEVGQTTFRYNKNKMDVYEPINVPDIAMKKVLNDLIDKYEEETYGFISWVSIFIRRIFEILGFNAKKWNILWGWGVICSELIWYYLYTLSLFMMRDYGWVDFMKELKLYNPNIFTPKDANYLLDKYDKLFRKI